MVENPIGVGPGVECTSVTKDADTAPEGNHCMSLLDSSQLSHVGVHAMHMMLLLCTQAGIHPVQTMLGLVLAHTNHPF
jgi:hypothetical protein